MTLPGSSEGQRNHISDALRNAGVEFHRGGGLVPGDSFLSTEDYAQLLAESKIVINTQTVPERVQLKGRVAQVLSCGSFLLEQRNSESERFLEGYDVDMWSDVDELIAKINWWLAHPGEREYAASVNHLHYIREHNPLAYTQRILDELGLR